MRASRVHSETAKRQRATQGRRDVERRTSRRVPRRPRYDITELPYFRNGINFMAPRPTCRPLGTPVWDSYQSVVENMRAKGLTDGIAITSHYEDRNGEPYQTAWMINPLLLEGSGYSDYEGYEDEAQAQEDQARVLEKISQDLEGLKAAMNRRLDGQVG